MAALKTALLVLLKLACYAGLAVVISGIAVMVLLGYLGVCPRLDGGGAMECASPTITALAQYAMAVILVTAFTGIPGLFAIGGLIFLVRDVMRRRQGS